MTDIFTPEKRAEIMSRISGKNTKPEIAVRSLLHRMGYRFRLHRRDLPGVPDICLPKYKTVIFVHGCYWHRHKGCKRGESMPKTNVELWKKKFLRTVKRDKQNRVKLQGIGWKVLVIWECELKDISTLKEKITQEVQKW